VINQANPYVIPAAPLEDDALDAVLQAMVVGITGLDPTLVRPRWQVQAPKSPETHVNWCSIGVMTATPDDNPFVQHLSGASVNDQAGDMLQEHEEMEVMASFIGPLCKTYLGIFRSGIRLATNIQNLKAFGLYFKEIDGGRAAPELINQQWRKQWDTSITLKRMVARVYGISNIINANVHLFDDSGHVDATIFVPPTSG
jgi:hypothetical protein